MGDLMHALPAITEAKDKMNDITFDWVVDKNFSSIPKWHPNVENTIETNHREWKLNLFSSKSRQDVKKVINIIDQGEYDLIVDMQNNLKSAFLSYMCKSQVSGLDAKSAREYPAHLAYKNKISVSKAMHAVDRQKILLASALGYKTNLDKIDYGISKAHFKKPLNMPSDNYAICVQNASWTTKQWPIESWKGLISNLEKRDITLLFPSGNQAELDRASEICSVSEKAYALEILPLDEIAYLIDNSEFALCSDTGLAHLSAVTDTPSLTLYGPTDKGLIGTYGSNQNHFESPDSNINKISVEDVLKRLELLNFI
tara:strand:- start:300 stop:1238 length:939 start_codon:yes stop_codon:yes gene_type:complete